MSTLDRGLDPGLDHAAADLDAEVDVLVVGAGQAGLGSGFWLSRLTRASFLIVDAAPRAGQSWCDRWDSLNLFTPRRFSALPGMRFPAGLGAYPSRDETARYLARYARRHDLPVRWNTRVRQVTPDGGGFVAVTDRGTIHARHVVVATGPFHGPALPPAAADLDPAVRQLHSSSYRRPGDIVTQDVLVVGGGNSAAQLACELAATHSVTVTSPGQPWYLPERVLGVGLYWWIYLTGTLNADADTAVARHVQRRGDPIIGRDLARLVAAGRVRLLPHRVVGARGRTVDLADGSTLTPGTVLWCTGYRPDYRWLQVPGALDPDGRPRQDGGASPVPGLHWMGLPWQTRLNSSIIDGVDRDARALASRLRDQLTAAAPGNGGTGGTGPETRRVAAYFDRHAARYDRQMQTAERLLLGAHRDWAVRQVDGRVLELGVGTGLNLPLYAPGVQVTGVELSEAMIEQARNRVATGTVAAQVDLRLGDVQHLPLADGSVDAALSTYTFCSIPDPDAAAREALRVVRPGGRLVLVEHGIAGGPLVRAAQRLLDPLSVRLHAEHLRRDPLPFLLRAGWQIETVERTGFARIVYRIVARRGRHDAHPVAPGPSG